MIDSTRSSRTPLPSVTSVLAAIALAWLFSDCALSNEPAAEVTTETPEVWLCHHDIEDLAALNADWDFVRAHLDGVKIYVGNLMGSRKHVTISDKNLISLATTFEQHGIQVAMECGGTLGHYKNTEPVGLRSASNEMRSIDRVASLGGTMHYLDLDGPISRTLWSGRHRFDHKKRGDTGFDNIDKCVEELITYMKAVNRRYADLKFFALTNFPNWGWKGGTSYHSRHEDNQDWGDYFDVISTLLRKAKEAGVTSLVGVTADSPYHYTIGRVKSVNLEDPSQVDWIARLRDLEDYVESQGLEFNLIANSVERLEVDAKTYCEETLALIELFRSAGGTPKRYIVQSWGQHPEAMLPESDPVSMTGLTKAVIMKVKGVDDDMRLAENVLLYQRETGGWPKNYDRKRTLTTAQHVKIAKDRSINDSMIDNGATHTEIRIMANASAKTQDDRFKAAAMRGIHYLLDGQYDNGGWPQQFPKPSGYARYITFNDSAMIGVMSLLKDIAHDEKTFSFVPKDVRDQCQEAVDRGIECILKCQIRVAGELTVWCAQHDHVSFEPQKARSYELASLSGSESVGIVRFLMQIERPADEVIRAIEGAAAWFERSKLEGIKVVRVKDTTKPGGYDRVVVQDPTAPAMWARFYDIKTNQPIFCSRDGVPRRTIAEISHERRNGYSWLGNYGHGLLTQDMPAWEKRIGQGHRPATK